MYVYMYLHIKHASEHLSLTGGQQWRNTAAERARLCAYKISNLTHTVHTYVCTTVCMYVSRCVHLLIVVNAVAVGAYHVACVGR